MKNKLALNIIVKVFMAILILGLLFFLPAGTLKFWQAWFYLGLLITSMMLIMIYLLRHDRALLERRLKIGEKEKPQKRIIKVSTFIYFLLFLIPGLDFRFGWSMLPVWIVVASDIVFLMGYYIFFLTLKENSYASRIIEVDKKQKVISTGPYAMVRYPMYAAILLIMGITPLCLGSYWGLIASLIPLLMILVFRILNEEKVLIKDLPGYKEYLQKIKYRLVPGIW